jgi:probable rRNA maturation factor
MTVRITRPARVSGLPDTKRLRSRAIGLLRELGRARAELSIALVADDEIAALNGAHRGKHRKTDVLSFSLMEGEHSEHRGAMLGDVVIGFETAARQARGAHCGFDDEVFRLLIHGTLHLLGWDHQSDADERAMRAEERRLWRLLCS